MDLTNKFILDACCGGRMMWFNKQHPNTLYIDNRQVSYTVRQGHMKNVIIAPDLIIDSRKMPFADKKFKLVVIDPPHFSKLGETSLYKKMFGCLEAETWQSDLKNIFFEGYRVLDDYGVLIVKWNDYEIPLKKILPLFPIKPLFGNWKNGAGQSKTVWLVFMKIPLTQYREDVSENVKNE